MWNLYFVRHGQTDRNAQNKMNPWDVDSLLNQNWIKQAMKAWKEAKNQWITFDLIISSPLKRALDTAQLIAKEIWYNKKIETDERLKEQYAWALKDYSHDDIKKEFKVENSKEMRKIFKSIIYNKKEDIIEFSDRVSKFYNGIKNQNKNILIVAHSWVSRIILMNAEKLDFEYAIYEMPSTPNATIIKLKNKI